MNNIVCDVTRAARQLCRFIFVWLCYVSIGAAMEKIKKGRIMDEFTYFTKAIVQNLVLPYIIYIY